jgi:hypothetical protein
MALSMIGCSKGADPGTAAPPASAVAMPTPPAPAPSAAGVGLDYFDKMRADLKKLGNDFVIDVRDGHIRDAYALMTTPYQKGVKLARFKSVARNPYLQDAKQFILYKTSGSLRAVKATGLLKGKSGEVDVTMSASKEAGSWKLNGFSIAGNPVVPAP